MKSTRRRRFPATEVRRGGVCRRPSVTILEALDDPKLFGPHFEGSTWAPWKALLRAILALPLSDTDTELLRAATGRQAPRRALSRGLGRRGSPLRQESDCGRGGDLDRRLSELA